jgi:hypothetical protein
MPKGKHPGNWKDLSGQRFGRLVVIECAGSSKKSNYQSLWKCKCDCGNTAIVGRVQLKQGDTKSCGCLRKELASENNSIRPYEALYNKLVTRCNRLGREISLTYEQFVEFTNTPNCHYCGEPVIWTKRGGKYKKTYQGCNLDRRDNSIGYTIKNCLVCCFPCNMMKQSLSYSDFMERIGKIYARHS